MNYSTKEEWKVKRKILTLLLGQKPKKETFRDIKGIFSFLSEKETLKEAFTVPQIIRNVRTKRTATYDFMDLLGKKKFVEEAGKIERTPGRGETKLYRLTTAGKILAAYIVDNVALLSQTLKQLLNKETNILKRFCLETFIENYPTQLMKEILGDSIKTAANLKNGEGFDVDDLIFKAMQETFVYLPFVEDDIEIEEIFKKNAELIEKSEHKDLLFQCFKRQVESFWLLHLNDSKLEKYVEALKDNPMSLVSPCLNPNCTNVVIAGRFLDLVNYCSEQCRQITKDLEKAS